MSGFLGALIQAPITAIKDAYKWGKFGYSPIAFTKNGFKGKVAKIDKFFSSEGSIERSKQHQEFMQEHWGKYITKHGAVLGTAGAALTGAAKLTVLPVKYAAKAAGHVVGAGIGMPLAGVMGGARLFHKLGKEAGGYEFVGKIAKPLGRAGWAVTKHTTHAAAYEGAKLANMGIEAGKLMYRMRNNPAFQAAMFLGVGSAAVLYGAEQGAHDATDGQVLPSDPYSDTFTNPQYLRNPEKTSVPIDDFGATGGLVFALNNLRKGGMM